jgi:superfamily II DNA/RNA helicase
MRHPVNIRAESAADTQMVPATAQFIYQVHDLDKTEMLARILQAENSGLTIVFTRTKRAAQRVADDLAERGFPASPLHGDMAQVAREKAMARFREGKVRVLVATDVAARGIDVQDVTHVINYSCPEDAATYVHRIGRTGRAGASGVAVTFVDWADVTRWKVINKELGLPFEEPAETYSTSDHFFHDMGIPPGTKGRVVDPAPAPERRKDDGEKRERAPRSSSRNRTRTRGGRPADGGTAAEQPAAEPAGEDGEKRPARKRNRRRSRSGQSSSSGSTSGSGTAD